MMDRLNILLSLEAKLSIPKKYIKNIIDKMNEKFEKNPLPVTLIFDKIKKNDDEFNSILEAVENMKNDLHRIKMIVIERNSDSKLNLGKHTPIYEIKNFDSQNGKNKIIEIVRNVAFQKTLYLDQYIEHLKESVYTKLNNNNKIIKFVTFIKKEQTNSDYTDKKK